MSVSGSSFSSVGPGRSTTNQLMSIQAGRAIAATSVAAFHLSLMMGDARYGGLPVLARWTQYGARGVDFFFVLSGFVILMAHQGDIARPVRVGRYLWKRFVRVYPIYWLYTSVLVLLIIAGLGNNTPLPKTLLGWLSTFTLIRFSPEGPPIYPAWTLFHEVAFYVLFASLIISRRFGVLLLTLWLAVCILFWQYPPEDGRTAFAVYLSAYSAHFLLGMLAFLAFRYLHWKACLTVAFAALAMFPLIYWVTKDVPRLAWASGFAGVLLIGATAERVTAFRPPRWLRYVGDSSYSLYLLHLALMGLLLKVATALRLRQEVSDVGTYFLVLLSVTLLACLAYRVVEAPLLRVLRSIMPHRSAASPVSLKRRRGRRSDF